jgi:hypothetical protein
MPETNESVPQTRSDIAELARLLGLHAPYDGIFSLRVPGVDALRASRVASETTHALQHAAVCIVAQGQKTIGIGDSVYEYGAVEAPARGSK